MQAGNIFLFILRYTLQNLLLTVAKTSKCLKKSYQQLQKISIKT